MSSFGEGGSGKSTAQAVVILPVTESITHDFVTRADLRYDYLAGNRPEVTKNTCGEWAHWGCLNSDKHGFKILKNQTKLGGGSAKPYDVIKPYKMSCGNLACPICYEKASAKLAFRIENRVKQFKRKGRETYYYHWTVSPSKKDVALLTFDELHKKAQKVAKMAGIQGGCSIFHHLRSYDERDLSEDIKNGASWKTAPASWHYSPHYHMIGVGFTSPQAVKHTYEETGWVIKNLGKRDSIRATALYQLSHAYVPKKGHAVRWWGVMSYNKLKVKPLPPEKHVCPDCGDDLKQVKPANQKSALLVKSILTEEKIYRVETGHFVYCESKYPSSYRGG